MLWCGEDKYIISFYGYYILLQLLAAAISLRTVNQAVALAPQPVLVGYSLVGVYPCAVWKPRNNCDQAGPVRARVADNVRSQPYPQPSTQNLPSTQNCCQSQNTTSTTATARLQPPQILVTACSCRETNNVQREVIPQLTNTTSPMLFVPFSVPNFAPPITGTAIHSNCSPSKVTLNFNQRNNADSRILYWPDVGITCMLYLLMMDVLLFSTFCHFHLLSPEYLILD